ncbi:hypothetical protein [Flavobacterium collinsii]|jgi:hypothetical protein|uniref:Uncharacterized protein n=1 Tax=Flavobacterium collinsii TaxID=1114861 RepID=A0A9W4TKB9_9FLAO|nr:hypothetical protein [Flavobacterium collinsii]CAI2768575.1 conserved protein of unknown function [Flavobacterium collinsii]
MTKTINIPQHYEQILNVWEGEYPKATKRARELLPILLEELLSSPNKNALSSSALTMTGSPFEPAFSLTMPGLRYTICPAPLTLPLIDSLEYSISLLSKLNVFLPKSDYFTRISKLQKNGTLTYGAQIGVRHSDTDDSFKLYIEVPPEAAIEADAIAEEILGSKAVLNVSDRNARPTIFGIDLKKGTYEVYYRIENLHSLEIATLLSRINASERASELLIILSDTQSLPIKHELPGAVWGFSYSKETNSEYTFSLYTFANTLFGPDGWVRDGILSLGEKYSWNLNAYSDMSQSLKGSRGYVSHHGIFGLVMPPKSKPAAWIGLAPIKI